MDDGKRAIAIRPRSVVRGRAPTLRNFAALSVGAVRAPCIAARRRLDVRSALSGKCAATHGLPALPVVAEAL